MVKTTSNGPSGQKPQWFARRQVYLRTGQDSQYVELSPLLQIGVAIGFGALALWLVGASYGAINPLFNDQSDAALLAKLESAERERDAALEDAARIGDLEAALVEARSAATEAQDIAAQPALMRELEQARTQLEDLQLRLSESKADKASLQARLEAQTEASDAAGETAEEVASLHDQLEEAFGEIETLREEKEAATAKLSAATEATAVKTDEVKRTAALLKAATAEIERLQDNIALAESESENAEDYGATIANLEGQLSNVVGNRDVLQQQVETLSVELENARSAVVQANEARAEIDAANHAQSIAAGLNEADLLTTIETLRGELAAVPADVADVAEAVPAASDGDSGEIASLREKLAIAESEIERLIVRGLTDDSAPVEAEPPTTEPSVEDQDPGEIQRLRADLLAAQADNIKLQADVEAARKRLAEQAEQQSVPASTSDNSAKLEQQLASTRSRVQQLNKALADAKLREVAVDLALINVVPSPSPPAPR